MFSNQIVHLFVYNIQQKFNVITFVSFFCKLFALSQRNTDPRRICNCDWLLPCLVLSFVLSHWRIPLQKCFHTRNVVSFKSKADFFKITEICDFWFKTCFLPKMFVSRRIGCVELKTDSRYAHWFRFCNFKTNVIGLNILGICIV